MLANTSGCVSCSAYYMRELARIMAIKRRERARSSSSFFLVMIVGKVITASEYRLVFVHPEVVFQVAVM
jgi:hypothetical protein